MSLAATVSIMATGPVRRVADVAVEAERLGYARCWLYDEGLATRDVYVTLSAIAVRTSRILLGPGITNPYTRHPGTTAGAVATLDELSGGRAFLGVGAGGVLTLRPLALERRRPARAVEEMVVAMHKLFAGEVVDLAGETVAFHDGRLAMEPRSGIEVWVAGRGSRVLDVGGRLADGVHLSYIHKERLGPTIARIRGAGRPVRVSYTTALVTHDAEFEQARAELSFRILDSPPDVIARIGATGGELGALRTALVAAGPTAAARHVRPEWVEQFALVGDAGQCAAELADLAGRHGIDEFQIGVHQLDGAEAQLEQGRRVLTL